MNFIFPCFCFEQIFVYRKENGTPDTAHSPFDIQAVLRNRVIYLSVQRREEENSI